MIDRLLQTLYGKVFVTIVVQAQESHVYVEVCSSKKGFALINNARATFETDGLNAKMIEFIESYRKESPYAYISILDASSHQGALPGCDVGKVFSEYDVSECEYRCVANKWTYYTLKKDLKALEKSYQKIRLDFVFSPFTVLSHFFKDKIETIFAMFILIQADQMSIAVFDKGALIFGTHVDMDYAPEEEGLNAHEFGLDLEDGIDLEEVDADMHEMELIDDFGDIEDLDSLEEIEEFSEEKDIEEVLYEATRQIDTSTSLKKDFDTDYQCFTLVQSTIANYYQNSVNENRFIENIYVADAVAMSSEFKRYLEEELFVNVYVRQTDLNIELCELAKRELRG